LDTVEKAALASTKIGEDKGGRRGGDRVFP
jgi:hypothetical protein